jgi:hypothetical protein
MNHTGTTGICSNCHNGAYIFAQADGQGVTHIPETRQCDTCHTSTVTWTLMSFLHPANAANRCAQCHSGAYLTENAQMKPTTHLVTTAQCDTCHSGYTSWATSAAPDHSTFVANCRNCHVPGSVPGPQGLTQPSTHIPVGTVQCDQCHNKYPALFKPATMTHTATGLALVCTNCHSGTYASVNALPKGATHIPTTVACEGCHFNTAYISWNSRVMSHRPAAIGTTACSTCHSGGYATENALGKGANHIPIGGNQCGPVCHTAPLSGNTPGFSPATMGATGHALVSATPCATCHGGAYVSENAQSQSSGHVPTAGQPCSNCHSGYVSWATGVFTHDSSTVGQCGISCHNNAATAQKTGLPKPANHLPVTITPCSVCHTAGTAPGGFSQRPFMNHGAAGLPSCLTCHNATYASTNANPQGATHIPTGTTNCGSCHKSTTDWVARQSSQIEHTFLTASTCTTCHSGGFISENAATKGSTHIPTSAQCNLCHTDPAYASWTVGTMNHSAVTGTLCGTCHNGAYLSEKFTLGGAMGKAANHIPYLSAITGGSSMDCSACHTGFTAWTTGEKMNHNNTQGNGAGYCKTCHQSSPGYDIGTAQTKSLTHQSKSATDCSASGCHKPLGSKGTAYKSWT